MKYADVALTLHASQKKSKTSRNSPPDYRLNRQRLRKAERIARAIRVPANRISTILKDERDITGDTAIRLGTFFKTSAEFWLNLKMTYDLRIAEKALPARMRKSIEENQKRPWHDATKCQKGTAC